MAMLSSPESDMPPKRRHGSNTSNNTPTNNTTPATSNTTTPVHNPHHHNHHNHNNHNPHPNHHPQHHSSSSSTCTNNPLFVHRKIEDEIEHFVENFKQKSSALDRRPSSDSGDSSGWTSSVFSATDTPSTDSPDRDGDLLPLPEEDLKGRNGIIAESRRIAQWALRQARYASTSRDSCSCTYHPKIGDVMGDTKPGYKVIDVAELLQSKFVIYSGGKAKNGAPIVTFPDRQGAPDVSDEDYIKVVTYLCDLVPLHEAESGFVVVIDRRQDGWGAARSILLKMSMFFPNHVQVVFLLQPTGFFQRAFADFRSKFVKEDLEFKVVLCSGPEEMSDYIDIPNLTKDVGGELTFDNQEWTEHRSAVEKFAQNADAMSLSFTRAVKRFSDLELPNAVHEMEAMVRCCMAERKELMDDFGSSTTHGNTLLQCIKGDNAETKTYNLVHVLELERLLVQLDETKAQFDQFWSAHECKMRQGLHLRQFEEDFKLIQFQLNLRVEQLEEKMEELGSSVAQAETMTEEFEKMEEDSQKDLDAAERMRGRGDTLMMEDQYAVDSIRPKCVELQRMCEQYKDLLRRRRLMLTKSHDLHDRLDRANRWCSRGVDLLASQTPEKCQTRQGAEGALSEIEAYLRSRPHTALGFSHANRWCSRGVDLLASQTPEKCQTRQGAEGALGEIEAYLHSSKDLKLSNPREFRTIFEEIMTPESRATVQQVLQRMEEMQSMCQKRVDNLNKTCHGRVRPKHASPGHGPGHAPGHAPLLATSPSPTHHDAVDSPSSSSSSFPSSSAEEPAAAKKMTAAGFLEKSARFRPDIRVSHASLSSNDNHSSGSSSGVSSKTSSIAASDVSSSGDVAMTSDSATQRSSLSSVSTGSLPELDLLTAKRRHVMNELIETEKTYVTELDEILRGYYREMDSRAMQHIIPPELIGQKHVLFGNLEQIFKFHSDHFLNELQECRDFPAKVGRCFINRKEEFQWYSMYCQNKPKSEALRMQVGDSNPFFKECQNRLGHKLPLGAFLLKPVQRITKYQLLLKEMLRFTGDDEELHAQLQEAMDTMLSVLQYLNASMHQVRIVQYQENLLDLGRLLMHGGFSVWTEHKRERIKDLRFKPMQRHIFLYERGLLLCKKKEETNNDPVYVFKNKLKLLQVGLTEKLKGDKRRFELWSRGREEVFIIQAPSLEVKDVWVKEIKRVLLIQFDHIKSTKQMYVPLPSEEGVVTAQLSSDSSDYSLDNWRGGGTTTVPTTTTTTTPASTSTSATTTTTTTTTLPPTPNHINNNNNNNSTLPMGLEMISPISPPSSSPFPHSLPHMSHHTPVDRGGGGVVGGGGGEDDEDGGWSSGEFSNDEENGQESSPGFEPSYRQQFVSLGDYTATDSSEMTLGEGEVVEVLRVGGNGWWYARLLTGPSPAGGVGEGGEGWVPSTYLEQLPPQSANSSSDSLSTAGRREMSLSRSSLGSPHYLSSPVSETTV